MSPQSPVVNIAATLSEVAQRFAEKPAVIVRESATSFSELEAETRRLTAGLRAVGVKRGTRTIVFVPPSVEFFALTFALFRIGAVPVLIDPGIGAQQMGKCLTTVDVQAFIGVPKAHVFRLLYRRVFRRLRTCITVGRKFGWGGWTLDAVREAGDAALRSPGSGIDDELAPTQADELAAVLFTSGSTGPAKGVEYTHGIFAAQVGYLQSHYGYGPDEIDLPTFPLFALFDAALGMTAVIPQMDFTRPGRVDPNEIIGPIQRHGCTHMFGSPALLRRVAEFGVARGVKLPTLKRVITAGAPLPPRVLEDFARLLPAQAEIFTPYGATEALPVASISHREILAETATQTRRGAGTCVGQPLAGIDVRVIAIDDAVVEGFEGSRGQGAEGVRILPASEIGEFCVAGPIVTSAYYRNADATAGAKIVDEHGRIWHRMGDVGYRDEAGRLWFCGRKAHRVPVASEVDPGAIETLFTIPCEAVFNEHPAVLRTALVGVRDRGVGSSPARFGGAAIATPVLCVELRADERRYDPRKLFAELRNLGAAHAHTRRIQQFLIHPAFPVDVRHNAKIFREKLAVWAAGRTRK